MEVKEDILFMLVQHTKGQAKRWEDGVVLQERNINILKFLASFRASVFINQLSYPDTFFELRCHWKTLDVGDSGQAGLE